MSSAPTLPVAFAPLHDELVLEARITLRDALVRLEEARAQGGGARGADAARREALALVAEAQELLQRAELTAVGVHGVVVW
jgi:hypothetical protein